MDRPFLIQLKNRFRDELLSRATIIQKATGRLPKRQVFLSLNACKRLFAEKYACEVRSRWSVGQRQQPSDTEVIEYLVDYSISRFSIPQAIQQLKDDLPELVGEQKYGLLLAVESELGDNEEIARDFLKLLDVKAPFKLLLFERRSDHTALYTRLRWVLAHHCSLDANESILLIGLPKPAAPALGDFAVKCVENGDLADLEVPPPAALPP